MNDRSKENEVGDVSPTISNGDMAEKRASFRTLSARLRRLTAGRKQTPSEILIREDRDGGHR